MLTILAFCQKDKPIAVLLASWIRDLGGVKAHECMLVHPPSTNADGVLEPLQEAFAKVTVLRTPDDRDGWPQGANLMLRRTAHQIQGTKPEPWLWLEPDAIPLVPTWLDQIEAEYKASGKPFMGARVEVKDVPVHMSGVGVYPGNAPTLAPGLVRADKVAFDVEARKEIVPRAHFTRLVNHEWKPKSFPDQGSLIRIHNATVIYHQSKDGALIEQLREARFTEADPPLNLPPDTGRRRPWPEVMEEIADKEAIRRGMPIPADPPRPSTPRETADRHAAALAKLSSQSHANRIVVANALKRAGIVTAPRRAAKRKGAAK